MRETSVRYRNCFLPRAADPAGLNLARIVIPAGGNDAAVSINFA